MRIFSLFAAVILACTCAAQHSWTLTNTGVVPSRNLSGFTTGPNGEMFVASWYYYNISPVYQLYRSTNDGKNWFAMNTGNSNVDRPTDLLYHNGKLLMCGVGSGTLNYVDYSTDNGATWNSSTGFNIKHTPKDFAVSSNGAIYLIADAVNVVWSNPILYRSTNGGVTWTQVTMTGVSSLLTPRSIFFDNSGRMYLSGNNTVYDNLVYTSTNQGSTWTQKTTGIPGTYYVNDFASGNGDEVYAVCSESVVSTSTYSPRVIVSKNRGESWTVLSTTGFSGLNTCYKAHNHKGTLFLDGNGYSGPSYIYSAELPSPPTVSTTAVWGITHENAFADGEVLEDGGAPVTQRGICWALTISPTTTNSIAFAGTGTGTFSAEMPSLQAGKTYYIRAFATNSISTRYGAQMIIKTDIAAGLTDAGSDQGFSIYPSPSEDVINIHRPGGNALQCTVFDVTGNAVLNFLLLQESATVNIGMLPAGMYVIRTEDGQTRRLVKQ